MSLQIKHFGKVIKGRKVYNNPELYTAQLHQLEGQEFEEIIKKRTRKTTLNQNSYYRGAILAACYQSEMFGHFDKPDDIHDYYFAPKFLSIKKMFKDHKGNNVEVTKVISMSEMTVEETSAFIEKVIADAASMDIGILSPDEYYNRFYK
jgi:hypothetical protein